MKDPGKEMLHGGERGHEGNARDIGSRHGDRDGVMAQSNRSPLEGHQGETMDGEPLGEYCREIDSLSTVAPGLVGAQLKQFKAENPGLIDLEAPSDLTKGLSE